MITSPFKVIVIAVLLLLTLGIAFNILDTTRKSQEELTAKQTMENFIFAIHTVSYGTRSNELVSLRLIGSSKIVFSNEVFIVEGKKELRGEVYVYYPNGNKVEILPFPLNYVNKDGTEVGALDYDISGNQLIFECDKTVCEEERFSAGEIELVVRLKSADKVVINGEEINGKVYFIEVSPH